jgi:bacterial/archaeal transporter family-2 protein
MNSWIILLFAVCIGSFMPTQAAVNNKLGLLLQSPVLAALISFLVGTVTLILYCFIGGAPLSQLAQLKNAPPVAWIGGLLGALYVVSVTTLVPRLGVALLFSLLMVGQLIVTLIFDHYGLLGVPVKEVNAPRLLGIILVVIGALLVRRY